MQIYYDNIFIVKYKGPVIFNLPEGKHLYFSYSILEILRFL